MGTLKWVFNSTIELEPGCLSLLPADHIVPDVEFNYHICRYMNSFSRMSNEKEEVTTQCSAGLNISGVRHNFEDVGITDSPDFESQALHLLLVRLALLLTTEDENCIISTICPFL